MTSLNAKSRLVSSRRRAHAKVTPLRLPFRPFPEVHCELSVVETAGDKIADLRQSLRNRQPLIRKHPEMREAYRGSSVRLNVNQNLVVSPIANSSKYFRHPLPPVLIRFQYNAVLCTSLQTPGVFPDEFKLSLNLKCDSIGGALR